MNHQPTPSLTESKMDRKFYHVVSYYLTQPFIDHNINNAEFLVKRMSNLGKRGIYLKKREALILVKINYLLNTLELDKAYFLKKAPRQYSELKLKLIHDEKYIRENIKEILYCAKYNLKVLRFIQKEDIQFERLRNKIRSDLLKRDAYNNFSKIKVFTEVDPNTSVSVPQIFKFRPETHTGSDWNSDDSDTEKEDIPLQPIKIKELPQELKKTYPNPPLNSKPYKEYKEDTLREYDENRNDLTSSQIAELVNTDPKYYLQYKQEFIAPSITFTYQELNYVKDNKELLMEIAKFERPILKIEQFEDGESFECPFLNLKEAREFLYARQWLIDNHIKNKPTERLNMLIRNSCYHILQNVTNIPNQELEDLHKAIIYLDSLRIYDEIRSQFFIAKIPENPDHTNIFFTFILQSNGRSGVFQTYDLRYKFLTKIKGITQKNLTLSEQLWDEAIEFDKINHYYFHIIEFPPEYSEAEVGNQNTQFQYNCDSSNDEY